MNLPDILRETSSRHTHLCPRQILGVRIGLAGMKTLGFSELPMKRQLLVISETDGCFVDGLIAATNCTVGHRTLRVEDYGKVAATFVDTRTGKSIRIVPALDIREQAHRYAPQETRHYFAQMRAYQIMPDEVMLNVTTVVLVTPVDAIFSRPGVRVNCDNCGEEILNDREIRHEGLFLCQSCAYGGYYKLPISSAVEELLPAME